MARAEVGEASPLHWGVDRLTSAYAAGELSPVAVTEEALARIARLDGSLHAFVTVTGERALEQAAAAEAAYQRGRRAPLLGVPVSVKDVFHIAGEVSTLGSAVHREHVVLEDSGVVQRLRTAGAVFVGKTNTAEFGQSATTDNLLGPDAANPWDPARTAGGSSGGAAASVAAGMAVVAVGGDGGGSIRIPAAFTGLVGLKPTLGLCRDEGGFRSMTPFTAPGPLTWRVADARVLVGVLAGRPIAAPEPARASRIGWCPRPEGRPVDPGVAAQVDAAAAALDGLGHTVEETALPLDGWEAIFGPLVLAEEQRERGHLLDHMPDLLTGYERVSLEAARALDPGDVAVARRELGRFRRRVRALFDRFDYLLTPATAVTAFPLGQRPDKVDGQAVSRLWGAFPFAVPFNVAGLPAASVPCGLSDGMPVGVQVVGPPRGEAGLLDLCAVLEEAVAFDGDTLRRRM